MPLIDLIRPRWKHSDPDTRLDAVQGLSEDETEPLARAARNDPDLRVRLVAIRKLTDAALLGELAERAPHDAERRAATDRLVAISSRGGPNSLAALETRLYRGGAEPRGRRAPLHTDPALRSALESVQDPSALAQLARDSGDPDTRLWATGKISDADELRSIALGESHTQVALAALERIQDETALASVAALARNEAVRAAAEKRLAAKMAKLARHLARRTRRRERRDSQAA